MQKFIIFGSNPGKIPSALTESFSPEFEPDNRFNPLEEALNSDADSVLLFGSKGDTLWSIRVRHAMPNVFDHSDAVGTGFLGLTDPIQSEPEPPKKWWQRLLD